MKAVNLYGIDDISVGEVPIPETRDNELFIKVKTCSVCGTDYLI